MTTGRGRQTDVNTIFGVSHRIVINTHTEVFAPDEQSAVDLVEDHLGEQFKEVLPEVGNDTLHIADMECTDSFKSTSTSLTLAPITPGDFYDSVMGLLQEHYGTEEHFKGFKPMDIVSARMAFLYFPKTSHCCFVHNEIDWSTRTTTGEVIYDVDCHVDNVEVMAEELIKVIDSKAWGKAVTK